MGRYAFDLPKFGDDVAVAVGFEPTEGLPPHTLSRRAPSAARTRHRRVAYLSRSAPIVGSLPGEKVAQQLSALVGEHA
jgi:hypothetical protein